MKRVVVRSAVLLVCAGMLVFALDYLSLRFQIPNRPQRSTVHLQPYIAVPRKDGKVEFMLDDPVDQPCVNSLLPHYGDSPCWYLTRHRSQRKDL